MRREQPLELELDTFYGIKGDTLSDNEDDYEYVIKVVGKREDDDNCVYNIILVYMDKSHNSKKYKKMIKSREVFELNRNYPYTRYIEKIPNREVLFYML